VGIGAAKDLTFADAVKTLGLIPEVALDHLVKSLRYYAAGENRLAQTIGRLSTISDRWEQGRRIISLNPS
jgi:hypothetical protein